MKPLPGWLQTYTGQMVFVEAPDPRSIVIEDIAHALSLQCRFNGHTRAHYSVAQHSVLVSRQTEASERMTKEIGALRRSGLIGEVVKADPQAQVVPAIARATRAIAGMLGLLHDASEAYISDVVRPFKQLLREYHVFEDRLQQTIFAKFDLPWPLPDELACDLKWHDNRLLATEKRDLLGPSPWTWTECPPPLEETIEPWSPEAAEGAFLSRFQELRQAFPVCP